MTSKSIDTGADRRVPLEEIVPEVLRRGGNISFIATGGSMWPHIRNGDMLAAVPLADDVTIRTGWVLVYETHMGRLAVHRVLGRFDTDTLKVRGDAATGVVERVPRVAVLGRIVSRKRHGRLIDMTTMPRLMEGWLVARSGVARVTIQGVARRARHRI